MPSAPSVPAVTQTSNFTLENGQRAVLVASRKGTKLSGTMQILAPLALPRTLAKTTSTSALTSAFKIGTFSISGVFTPERSFKISVKDGSETLFSMTGLFPTATDAGSYNLKTVNGQTDSGVIPRIGDATPAVTPAPTTPSPAPTNPTGSAKIDLAFTTSADSNYIKVPLTTAEFTQAGGIVGVGVKGDDGTNFTFLTTGNLSAVQGSSFTFTPDTLVTFYIYDQSRSGVLRPFFVRGGTVTLTALSATSATIAFKDVLFVANEGSAARGSITVNGTVSGPLKVF